MKSRKKELFFWSQYHFNWIMNTVTSCLAYARLLSKGNLGSPLGSQKSKLGAWVVSPVKCQSSFVYPHPIHVGYLSMQLKRRVRWHHWPSCFDSLIYFLSPIRSHALFKKYQTKNSFWILPKNSCKTNFKTHYVNQQTMLMRIMSSLQEKMVG